MTIVKGEEIKRGSYELSIESLSFFFYDLMGVNDIYKDANLPFSVTPKILPYNRELIRFSSQDKGLARLVFEMRQGKNPYNLTGVIGEVTLVMANGSRFIEDANILDPTSGTIEYVLTDEQLRCVGKAKGELILKLPNQSSVAGFLFEFVIEASLKDKDLEPIEEYYFKDFIIIKEKLEGLESEVDDLTVIQVNGAKKDTEGVVHASLDSRIKAEIGKLETKQGDITTQLSKKASQTDLVSTNQLLTQIGAKQSEFTTQLAETVKEVNGVKPTNGKITIPVPEVDTSKLATKQELTERARQVDLLTEKARIDNLARLEQGSTTGDAELIDARVGANGITYASAGESVRNQFNFLNEDLNKTGVAKRIKTPVSGITGEVGYLDLNGVRQGSTSWVTTPYTPCDNLIKLIAYIRQYETILSIAYYDVNKTFISGQKGVGATPNTVNASIPSNAVFYRMSWLKDDNTQWYEVTISDLLSYKKEIEELKTKSNLKVSKTNVSEIVGQSGYVDTNGVRQATNSFVTTYPIDCRDIVSLKIKVQQYTNILYVSFYDKWQNFISGIVGQGTTTFTGDVDIPANATFLKMSFLVSNNDQWYEITRNIIKSQTLVMENANNPLYGKVLISTGDSINTTTVQRPYSGFARMVALKNQMTHESHAIWGATLPVNTNSSGSILATIPNMRSDADYIVLSGGVNDWYHVAGGREPLGVITEGYTSVLDDTTFYGALEKLCKLATEKWASKKIIYVITHKILDISTDKLKIVDGYVEGMKTILRKWGIPYVDLYNTMPSLFLPTLKDLYTTNGNTVYAGVGDGLHPNKLGYEIYYNSKVESLLKSI